jgi:hypothetical protein
LCIVTATCTTEVTTSIDAVDPTKCACDADTVTTIEAAEGTPMITISNSSGTPITAICEASVNNCSLQVNTVCQQCNVGFVLDITSTSTTACVASDPLSNYSNVNGTLFNHLDSCNAGFYFGDDGTCSSCSVIGGTECNSEFEYVWPSTFVKDVVNQAVCKAVTTATKCLNGQLIIEGSRCVSFESCTAPATRERNECKCPKNYAYAQDGDSWKCSWEKDCYKELATPVAFSSSYQYNLRDFRDCLTRDNCVNKKCLFDWQERPVEICHAGCIAGFQETPDKLGCMNEADMGVTPADFFLTANCEIWYEPKEGPKICTTRANILLVDELIGDYDITLCKAFSYVT